MQQSKPLEPKRPSFVQKSAYWRERFRLAGGEYLKKEIGLALLVGAVAFLMMGLDAAWDEVGKASAIGVLAGLLLWVVRFVVIAPQRMYFDALSRVADIERTSYEGLQKQDALIRKLQTEKQQQLDKYNATLDRVRLEGQRALESLARPLVSVSYSAPRAMLRDQPVKDEIVLTNDSDIVAVNLDIDIRGLPENYILGFEPKELLRLGARESRTITFRLWVIEEDDQSRICTFEGEPLYERLRQLSKAEPGRYFDGWVLVVTYYDVNGRELETSAAVSVDSEGEVSTRPFLPIGELVRIPVSTPKT